MPRPRVALAVAAALLAAYALLRAAAAPEPYATLAGPAPSVAPVVGAGTPPPPPPEPAGRRAPPSAAAVRALLVRLDAARAAGYADPAAADPDAWAAPSCACRAEDARRLRGLAARGLRLRGHRATLLAVRLTRAGPAGVTAVVTDRLTAYAAVGGEGRTVARWPATGPRVWRVTLVPVAGRWVLGRIVRGP